MLKDLRTEHIQKMVNNLLETKLSPRTIKYTITVLSAALDQAIKNELIFKNAAKNASLPTQEKSEIKIISMEDQTAFLKHIKSHRLRAAFIIIVIGFEKSD